MTSAPGWYPDPTDQSIMRYWDGMQWTSARELRTSGLAGAGASVAATAERLKVSGTAMFLLAGCAVAAAGTMLPWEQDTTPFGGQLTAGPSSVPGGVALLFALIAGVVWLGWPLKDAKLSTARGAGLTVVAALLAYFVFAKFSALADAQSQASAAGEGGLDLFGDASSGLSYHAGSGLLIYAAGVVAIWVGVVRAWLAHRVHSNIVLNAA